MTLETERLRLVLADAALLALELSDRAALWKRLACRPPSSWPAPLNDEASFTWAMNSAKANPGSPWGFYYFLLKDGPSPAGNGGFKAAPDKDGMVELGYSIIPELQGRGLATEATAGMIRFAASQPGVRVIRAETLPELKESVRVMEKNGLRFVGEGSEPGVIRYERRL